MSRRLALLISNNQYSDINLTKLAAPLADAESLAAVLRDPVIGAFDNVQTVINQPSADVRHEIAEFFHGKQPNDLLGHGKLTTILYPMSPAKIILNNKIDIFPNVGLAIFTLLPATVVAHRKSGQSAAIG